MHTRKYISHKTINGGISITTIVEGLDGVFNFLIFSLLRPFFSKLHLFGPLSSIFIFKHSIIIYSLLFSSYFSIFVSPNFFLFCKPLPDPYNKSISNYYVSVLQYKCMLKLNKLILYSVRIISQLICIF